MESCLRKSSIDTSLDVILAFGGYAHRPLMTLFRENESLQQLKLTFLYGEKDFFVRENADILIKEGTLKNARVFSVPASGHHPYIDNPSDTSKFFISTFLEFEDLKVCQQSSSTTATASDD